MLPVYRKSAIACALLMLSTTLAATGAAHEDHTGPGSAGPDQHSRNMKLLANVARSAAVTQSDLAFDGHLAFAGNYGGFRVIDVSDPENPVVITDFRCNGAQGDVSVWGGLLFQSVDAPQTHGGCDSTNTVGSTPGMFEGLRIFDVSDPRAPVHVASVATDCGSHTHTLVPDPSAGRAVVYVSSYPLGAAAQGPNCQGPHGYISIVEVPLAAPASATVTRYHLDPDTEVAHFDLSAIGATPPNDKWSFVACHDVSVFLAIGLAAGACMSEAQVWDISDPLNPVFLWRFDHPVVDNGKVDLWHSATFSWDGKVVAFGDESGGGALARCTDPNDLQGRIWFLDLETRALLANYKVPRSETGTCTMHNFNFLPTRDGSKILVSSAYTAGTTVVDVDRLIAGASAADAELGFYKPSGGNTWSSYWYNGLVFTNDILRGVDVMLFSDPARADAVRLPMLNPQTQDRLVGADGGGGGRR